MGCDIHAFAEIESDYQHGEFDSLFDVQWQLLCEYELFAALAGVRGSVKPLFPPRGIPDGLGAHGFRECYREIVSRPDALQRRGGNVVFPDEIGNAQIVPDTISDRWGCSGLGYIEAPFEVVSWLMLWEIDAALEHAKINIADLPEGYRFLFLTMRHAEATFGRRTRLVFHFDSV